VLVSMMMEQRVVQQMQRVVQQMPLRLLMMLRVLMMLRLEVSRLSVCRDNV
jgi:hypothetical protein